MANLQAELMRWQQHDAVRPYVINVLTEKGNEDAALLLLQYVYQDTLPEGSSEAQLETLLQILMLADRFEVQGCVDMACQRLIEAPASAFTASIVQQLLALPPGFMDAEGVLGPVVDRLQVSDAVFQKERESRQRHYHHHFLNE